MHPPLILRRLIEFVPECVRAWMYLSTPWNHHYDFPCSVSRRTADTFLSFLPLSGFRYPASSAAHTRSSPQLQPSAAQLPHSSLSLSLRPLPEELHSQNAHLHAGLRARTRNTVLCSRQPNTKFRNLVANPPSIFPPFHPSTPPSILQWGKQ